MPFPGKNGGDFIPIALGVVGYAMIIYIFIKNAIKNRTRMRPTTRVSTEFTRMPTKFVVIEAKEDEGKSCCERMGEVVSIKGLKVVHCSLYTSLYQRKSKPRQVIP